MRRYNPMGASELPGFVGGVMEHKLNCWEFKACGREPGGPAESSRGACPAATDSRGEGIHDGIKSGRVCWLVAGGLCDEFSQGSFSAKPGGCLRCDFYQHVVNTEGPDLVPYALLHARFK